MNSLNKIIALGCATAMAAAVPFTSASAGDRGWRDAPRDGYYRTWRRPPPPQPRRHHNNDNAIALGLGIAAGAVILGAIASQNSAPPAYAQPRYVEPAPRYAQPSYVAGGYEPWSPGWYQYCDAKYRTFNARTGTYRGYDGLDHFCEVR